MVERHQRRVDPGLGGAELQRRVREVFRSYGRYYGESFRLPDDRARASSTRGITFEGFEHVERVVGAAASGPCSCLPHLGSWEWCAYWLTRVQKVPVTAVVERVEPPALFDWFVEFRERIGMQIVPLGPDAGRSIVGAIKQAHVVALLCDRDIGRRRRRGHLLRRDDDPALRARRCWRCGRAPRCSRPASTTRAGDITTGSCARPSRSSAGARFRDDVARITQAMADELEGLIRRRARAVAPAPAQLAQRPPPAARRGPAAELPPTVERRPMPRPALRLTPCASGSSAPTASRCRAASRRRCWAWPARCGRWATTSGCWPRATARRPTRGVTPARQERADRRQRVGRPARARPRRPAAHHPGPAGRGVRRRPPARAAGARARR